MKKIFQFLLKIVTSLIIKKYNPLIIAVTGSVGKTSTKEGVYAAFSGLYSMQRSFGNLNTEIGAPLVFLREKSPGKNPREWINIFLKGVWLLLKKDDKYPKIVAVEIAADKPGDIKYLANFIKPDIGIVTAVGDVPVHVEFYKNPGDVAKEKEELIKAIKENGTAITNIDDELVRKMHPRKNAKIKNIKFGYSKGADVLIKSFYVDSVEGSLLKLRHKGEDFSIFLSGCFGKSFAYIAASIFAVGVALKIEPHKIPDMIKKIRPDKGRMKIIKGKKDSIIIDGSYNAAPLSMISSLDTLKDFPGKRKIAVLGEMREIGDYSKEEHRKVGESAGKLCDYIFTIGQMGKYIKEGAIKQGLSEKNIKMFSSSDSAIEDLEKIISPQDIILVKGSQGSRTEKVITPIMRDPERAKELLIRQGEEWQ